MNWTAPTLVDLSVPLAPGPSEPVPVAIEYLGHEEGGGHLARLVGLAQDELPDGLAWASERIAAITHAGTHVDAPYHYAPRCGETPSRTIDEIPVEWFWGPGLCVPLEGTPQDQLVEVDELLAFERQVGHRVGRGDIVLFHTGAAAAYGTAEYLDRGRGLSPSLVALLTARGVRVIGTDAWSIDPPLACMRRHLPSEGSRSVWAAHYTGRAHEFCAIEKLCNLDRLPAAGFWLACFPVKIHRGSAGWARVVAFLPRIEHP